MTNDQIEISAVSALAPLFSERAVLLSEHHAHLLIARVTEAARAHRTVEFVRSREAREARVPVAAQDSADKPYATVGFCPTRVLQEQLAVAIADPEIKSIIFDMDTPGGMVDGTVEFADAVAA